MIKFSRLFRPALPAMILLMLCACTKDGPQLFQGNYSFKTSGNIEVQGEDNTYTLMTATEIGQMHINAAKDGSLKVSMNIIGGGVLVFDAKVSRSALVLMPRPRKVHLTPQMGLDFLPGFDTELTMSGTGRKSGKDILFNFEYSGNVNGLLLKGTVTRSAVECIASRNE